MADSLRLHKGMLWYDADANLHLHLRVNRAVAYFFSKHGKKPLCCYVHPNMLPPADQQLAEIAVYPNQHILPHHFWLEFED